MELEQADRIVTRLDAGEPTSLVLQEEAGDQNYPSRQFVVISIRPTHRSKVMMRLQKVIVTTFRCLDRCFRGRVGSSAEACAEGRFAAGPLLLSATYLQEN